MTLEDLDPARSALIVVDAQEGFVTGHSVHVLPVLGQLLRGFRSAGAATVVTQFVNAPGSPYVRLIGWGRLMPGDPAVDLHPAIAGDAALADLVVRKGGYTALVPAVVELLTARGVTDVVVGGLDTESCVLATVLGAFETGLTPWLVVDASASHAGPAEHHAGLLVARRFVGAGQLVTAAAVLAAVERTPLRHAAG